MKFNKNSDKYRIKLIDYSEYSTPDDWDAGKKRFNTDLTSGNTPDIIVPDPADGINLISKGAMADLTPLMANGNGIKKEDLVYNAQNAFAKDGSLEQQSKAGVSEFKIDFEEPDKIKAEQPGRMFSEAEE